MGKRYFFSRAILFREGTTFGFGKCMPGPSWDLNEREPYEIQILRPQLHGLVLLSTILPRALGSNYVEELVDSSPEEDLKGDSPSEELDASSKELVEAPAEEELEQVGKTSALGFRRLEAEQILPSRMPFDRSSSGVLMQGKSFIKPAIVISHRLKKTHRVGNLFGSPTLIFCGNACNHPAINIGREARELRMAACHLGADQSFRNVRAG
ncbi:hypothetical protein Cgig2_021676 [Carnegiea gigantea]|uniref:Uncharacterized protein n=1 Tax=Carnegiea gigantea TaxID=171969 RepID=A0A9Q1KTN5_9CARY|nr:hypothetical protein Cgig2_021676 [Carnegiea gigantea]